MKARVGICAAALVLCAAVTVSAETAQVPPWVADAAARWDACGKLDDAMSLDKRLTRKELAVVLDSVLPAPETASLSYTDLVPGTPENDAMLRLAAAGLLRGDGLGRLAPDRTVTRQELAVLLFRAFAAESSNGAGYTDAADIAPWAMEAVAGLQQAGIMVGSEGRFFPECTVTYGEALQAVHAALTVTGRMTGLTVETRNEAGVLAQGQPGQVNDGKFSITAVEETDGGYVLSLRGLEALTGEAADSNGPGAPATDGKWMGLCLTFHGLVCADELQYSLDGQTWTDLTVNESLDDNPGAPATDGKWMGLCLTFHGLVCADELQYSLDGQTWTDLTVNESLDDNIRSESVMLYVNGAATADVDGPEAEKERTLTIRQADGAWSTELTVRYTPAGN